MCKKRFGNNRFNCSCLDNLGEGGTSKSCETVGKHLRWWPLPQETDHSSQHYKPQKRKELTGENQTRLKTQLLIKMSLKPKLWKTFLCPIKPLCNSCIDIKGTLQGQRTPKRTRDGRMTSLKSITQYFCVCWVFCFGFGFRFLFCFILVG